MGEPMPYAAEDADTIPPLIHELREKRRRAMVGNPPPVEVASILPRCQCPQIGGYGEAYRRTVASCQVHGPAMGG